jgi:hypothetical protein
MNDKKKESNSMPFKDLEKRRLYMKKYYAKKKLERLSKGGHPYTVVKKKSKLYMNKIRGEYWIHFDSGIKPS